MKYVIDADEVIVTVQGDSTQVYLTIGLVGQDGGWTANLSPLDVTELTFALNRCKEGVKRL